MTNAYWRRICLLWKAGDTNHTCLQDRKDTRISVSEHGERTCYHHFHTTVPGIQNEPRQMFKNFVFKTAQTSSIADRLIFSARFSLIKHARHWFLGFYHVARHELLVLKSINISEYQSEAFSWNVLVFLRTVNFTLFLNLMFKW